MVVTAGASVASGLWVGGWVGGWVLACCWKPLLACAAPVHVLAASLLLARPSRPACPLLAARSHIAACLPRACCLLAKRGLHAACLLPARPARDACCHSHSAPCPIYEIVLPMGCKGG